MLNKDFWSAVTLGGLFSLTLTLLYLEHGLSISPFNHQIMEIGIVIFIGILANRWVSHYPEALISDSTLEKLDSNRKKE